MNKKGFTLVELLAVIAILAILVIMALPAVLSMFTKARVDTFQNEVRTIYRTAQQQYILGGGASVTYGNNYSSTIPSGKKCNVLEMTGNANLKYYITIDGSGKVTRLMATNGTYNYDSTAVTDLQINDIEVDASTGAVTPTNCPLIDQ